MAAVFAADPPSSCRRMMVLRELIFAVAAKTEGVGELEEPLKWGDRADVTSSSRTGSTVRIAFSATRRFIAAAIICGFCTACTFAPTAMNSTPLTRDAVTQFLNRFEALAEQENFDLIQDMVHDRAVFRFNDGDFVGKPAVRGAFEKTWKSSAGVKKERFYLTDIVVLSVDQNSATATYTYHWEGSAEGKFFRIQGRGTRVLVLEAGRLQIIHEHLSRFPKP